MELTINDFLRQYEEGQLEDELTPRERTLNVITAFLDKETDWYYPKCEKLAEALTDKLEEAGVLV